MCGIIASIKDPRCRGKAVTNGSSDSNDSSNSSTNSHVSKIQQQLEASLALISHRGPDGSGTWISPDGNIALGHCRLAINDLSRSGQQPLTSDDGQIHAVVIGEIYDQARLRDECSQHGYRFVGRSDSELVLALYKSYGAPGLFEHLRGEFAFVLHDGREGRQRVIAARDRFGIKPLFWTQLEGRILMAAEAKAFLPLGWSPRWDVKALVTYAWELNERTLFRGVTKVLPGEWVEISDAGVSVQKYWEAEFADKRIVDERSVEEMTTGVRDRLVEAVRLRLQADVPVGIYLSGGIDSSAVAGIAAHLARDNKARLGSQATSRITCFTVEFPHESGVNESDIAERTAAWLGAEFVKVHIDEAALAHAFVDAAWHAEAHHFDLNSVAKMIQSTMPQLHGVKVVLVGEGSDELFAGYSMFLSDMLREPDLAVPASLLARHGALRDKLLHKGVAQLHQQFASLSVDAKVSADTNHPALATINNSAMPAAMLSWHVPLNSYHAWALQKAPPGQDILTVIEAIPAATRRKMASSWHPLHTGLYIWQTMAFHNLLLATMGDRAEMAHSIEGRHPFLDHHLAQYVNGLPPSVKISPAKPSQSPDDPDIEATLRAEADLPDIHLPSLTEKCILREAVRPFVTDELYRRKKQPFVAPASWPEDGPIYRLLQKLLTRQAVEQLGFVHYDFVADMMPQAFGKHGDVNKCRALLVIAVWVTLAHKMGIPTATVDDWID